MNKKTRQSIHAVVVGALGIGGMMFVVILASNTIRGCRESWAAPSRRVQEARAEREATLRYEMAYLPELPEVDWCVVKGEDVWVGFSAWPADGQPVINGAAVYGSERIDGECTVWAVRADQRAQCPPGPERCYGWASARTGKLRGTPGS